VADLDRQVEFYREVIGFRLRWRDGGTAGLGAGNEDLLRLTEVRGARRYRNTTGLYHFAILVPSRKELARALARLFALRYPNAPTDHVITQTTYLDDSEGNGIELYADTPEEGQWSFTDDGFVVRDNRGFRRSGRDPLDVEALLCELTSSDRLDAPMPEDTKMGHVHLHVANLGQAVHFYHAVIGFDVMGHAPAMGAAFVSAGGYHHHIGLNTWKGEGAPPAPSDALGLRYLSFVLPNSTELERVAQRARQVGASIAQTEMGVLVRDPSQNAILLADGSEA
jgi:catechol 2,3-dioxygenase